MSTTHSSAIVMGASMSGLLAARVLSSRFDRVTVVERDRLPDEEIIRKGAPQGAHVHGLLASGYRVLDNYFPGLMDDLEAQGAPRGDVTGDYLWFQYGHWKLRHHSGLAGITVSRPCLEAAVRRRVRKIDNVTFVEDADAEGPVFDAGTGRVRGAVVRPHTGEESRLDADLVIDATGRGSQSPKWLEAMGFGRPQEISLNIKLGYATRTFQRRPYEFFNSMGALVSGKPPSSTRFGTVVAVERARWIVTLAGMLGDYPPVDEAGWNAFAASLPATELHDLVTAAPPLTDIVPYRFPADQRRLYERMKSFPSGYLVMGDAVCSFNPIYAQGMSVAAMEARVLDGALEQGLDGLAPRFFSGAKKVVDIPWAIAAGEDLRFPQVEGRRPPGTQLINRYLERVHAVASRDRFVCRKFFEVLNLLAPPTSLLAPSVAWRVLRQRVPDGPGVPWGEPTESDLEHRRMT